MLMSRPRLAAVIVLHMARETGSALLEARGWYARGRPRSRSVRS